MKILAVGNCQARPVSEFLARVAPGIEPLEPIILHLARPEEADTHRYRMREADLILAQNTNIDFEPGHLTSSTIRENYLEKTLIWPNVFYAGQQPYLRYITHSSFGRIMGPLDAYHDLRILRTWYVQRLGHDPLPYIHPLTIHQNSLATLRQREDQCDVGVADIIASEWNKHALFFTFNHPNTRLLVRLCMRIAQKVGVSVDLELTINRQPLGRIIAPSIWQDLDSMNAVFHGVKIDFSKDHLICSDASCEYSSKYLKKLSFKCYDRQGQALLDFQKIRETPHHK